MAISLTRGLALTLLIILAYITTGLLTEQWLWEPVLAHYTVGALATSSSPIRSLSIINVDMVGLEIC